MPVDVITTVAGLVTLEAQWAPLAARFATPLLDWEWSVAAARTLYRDGDLRVVVVRDGSAVGIAPLAVSERFGRRVTILGGCTLYEPGGWLYTSDAIVDPLARAALRLGQVSTLQRLPPALADRLPAIVRGYGLAVVRRARPSLGVDTAGGWDAHVKRLSASARKAQRHMRGRLARAGHEMAVARLRPTPDELQPLIDDFVAVEASGWKGHEGSALTFHASQQAFYRAYLASAATERRAVISTLTLGGAVVAMELAVEAHRRVWSLKIGYDERFATLGPGLLLTDHAVRAVFEEGLLGYEFLGAAEAWQERWSPSVREYRHVTLYPFSSRGLLGAGLDAVQYLGRRLPFARSA